MFDRLSLIGIICCLSSAVAPHTGLGSILDCEDFRVNIPILVVGGRTVCGASFKFGQYIGDVSNISDLPRSSSLSKQFEELPEAKRWKYPEYAMTKYFEACKSGDQAKAVGCCVPGHTPSHFKGFSPQMKQRCGPFENVYAYRTYFGPYVEVGDLYVKFPEHAKNKEANVLFGGSQILRNVSDIYRIYMLTFGELTTTHIFREVTFNIFSLARKNNYVLRLQDIPQLSNGELSKMKWFAMDTKVVGEDDRKTLFAYSNREQTIPASFSDNYLKVYMDLEPVNIQLKAGQRAPNLSPEVRFFESAVTATHVGRTESNILAPWCEEDRAYIKRRIKNLKKLKGDKWSKHYFPYIGSSPAVLAKLRTSDSTLIYFKDRMQNDVDVVGVNSIVDGYSLFRLPDNIFRSDEFKEAVKILYGE